jgi:hypothetical protein
MKRTELILPCVTNEQKREFLNELKAQEKIFLSLNPKGNWRQEYFKEFPEMDNSKGISKLNNFWYSRSFDIDIYRSLKIFFKILN